MKYRELKAQIDETLAGPALDPEVVIGACENLAREIRGGKYDGLLGRYERLGKEAGGGSLQGKTAGSSFLRAKV